MLNIWIDGDRVVYDVPNEKYFYPHLYTMFGMTYDEQEDAISDLDYAEIDEWRWAYYADMMPMRVSMFGRLILNNFNMATGKNTNRFFRSGRIGDGKTALSSQSLDVLQQAKQQVETVIRELSL